MDALLKRHFWMVNLLTLALLAWLVASSINDYLASRLFAVPSVKASTGARAMAGTGTAPGAKNPEAGHDLQSWGMFNLGERQGDTKDPDEKDENKGTEEPKKPEGELEESELPIDVMGTIVASDATLSLATLRIEGENKLAWVGSEFLDGKAKITEINPRHIVLMEGETRRVKKLWAPKSPMTAGLTSRPGSRSTSARASTSARRTASKVSSSGRIKAKKSKFKNIKKTGPYAYEISRKELNKYIDDLGGLGSQARILPNHVAGKTHGYKLVGVRPNSLFRAIGIRSGDVIMSVNGQVINSAAKALGLFDKLKSEPSVTVEIERRGQSKELNYTIQ
jgi:type II secretion system protein C